MKTPVIDGRSIDQFIPAHLQDMFYRHPMPQYKYAIHDGYAPYSFSTDGLVLYLPLFALRDSPLISVDAYKHSVIVTGALWRPYGRLFDGGDKLEESGTFMDTVSPNGTFLVWLNLPTEFTTGGGSMWFLEKVNDETGGTNDYIGLVMHTSDGTMRFYISKNNVVTIASSTTTIWSAGWYFVHATWGSAGMILRVNKSAEGTHANTLVPDAGSTRGFVLGAANFGGGAVSALVGSIGEAWVYERALSSTEGDFVYDATKWRYPNG